MSCRAFLDRHIIQQIHTYYTFQTCIRHLWPSLDVLSLFRRLMEMNFCTSDGFENNTYNAPHIEKKNTSTSMHMREKSKLLPPLLDGCFVSTRLLPPFASRISLVFCYFDFLSLLEKVLIYLFVYAVIFLFIIYILMACKLINIIYVRAMYGFVYFVHPAY